MNFAVVYPNAGGGQNPPLTSTNFFDTSFHAFTTLATPASRQGCFPIALQFIAGSAQNNVFQSRQGLFKSHSTTNLGSYSIPCFFRNDMYSSSNEYNHLLRIGPESQSHQIALTSFVHPDAFYKASDGLPQPLILSFRFLINWQIPISILPPCKKILIRFLAR